MIPFDRWLSENCTPPANYSLAQYARYVEGWRNSMPWAYAGMSLAFDRWAENQWDAVKDADCLKRAWRYGMAIIARARQSEIDRAWANRKPEEAADFALYYCLQAVEYLSVRQAP